MNDFGGNWTQEKIEILVEYARAYLSIMGKRNYFKLLYFDGFAGSGFIVKEDQHKQTVTVGAARRIIMLDNPRPFDAYYFVEKDESNFINLEKHTKHKFKEKDIYVVCGDCNTKLKDMVVFLKKNPKFRTLAYIDPCGMQVEWASMKTLKGLSIDVWILVPTGLGVNRLLTKSGEISDAWVDRLKVFLGMSEQEIRAAFYKETATLFEDIQIVEKKSDAINKSAKLYKRKLNEVFNFVSQPYELKNSTNSVMYHLFFASNNSAGLKIANDIVKKYQK